MKTGLPTEGPAEPKPRQTKRRGNGEGCIYLRNDGRWVAMLTVGYDGNGKRKRRAVFGKTKKEVQDKLTKMQASKIDGTMEAAGRMTVAKYLDKWLEDAARPKIRATTYANYQGVVKNHIKPRIGGFDIKKLTPLHVQGLYAEMERAGSSVYTRHLAHAVLRKSLKQALRWNMVIRNVCEAVDPPRIEKTEITTLSVEQVGTFLQTAADDRLNALYVLAVATGLRLGELFGLHWSDIDLEAGTLNVRRTLVELNGKLSLGEPKTSKSRRRVELPQSAVAALWDHKRAMLAEGHAKVDFVFCNPSGGPLRRSHFHRDSYKPLLTRAGLPSIRFHDLRHTSATMLLTEGVHPKIVQERLGHSQISITMDTYSHVLPTMQVEAAGKLDALMGRTKAAAVEKAKAAKQAAG